MVKIIDPVSDTRWNEFIHHHKASTIYHSREWAYILSKTFGYKPYYIVKEIGNEITAALPLMLINSWLTGKRLVSLPRTPYCDPLVNSMEDFQDLVHYSCELVNRSGIKYVELKPMVNTNLFSDLPFKSYSNYLNHIISLDGDIDKLWSSFHRSCVRQRIQKSQEFNVKVRKVESIEDLDIYYSLHKKKTKAHMIPRRPLNFFSNMWKSFENKKHLRILLAEVGGKAIGANISFIFGETLYFEFLELDYDYLKLSPGHLLLWEGIKIAHEENLKYVDLGITHLSDKNLQIYKRRWSAEEHNLSNYFYPDVCGYKRNEVCRKEVEESNTAIYKYKRRITTNLVSIGSNHFG